MIEEDRLETELFLWLTQGMALSIWLLNRSPHLARSPSAAELELCSPQPRRWLRCRSCLNAKDMPSIVTAMELKVR